MAWGLFRGDPRGGRQRAAAAGGTAGCKSAMPHTHTDYDGGITGLGTAWYGNTSLTGAATAHSTAAPAQWGTGKPHEALPSAAGWSGRMSGELRNVPAGTYTFAAQVDAGADDGVRVFLDDQLVLERWDTIAESILDDRPIGYWRLGEATGATAVDSSGNGRNGTYAGVTLGRPGAAVGDPNTAAGFAPASGSRVNLANNPLYGVLRPTVEAWFKTGAGGSGVIVGVQNVAAPGTPGSYNPLLYVGTDGYLYGKYWPDHLDNPRSILPVRDNAWHHAVLVLDEASKQTLWLDGTVQDQVTGAVGWLDETTAAFGAAAAIPGGCEEPGRCDEPAAHRNPGRWRHADRTGGRQAGPTVWAAHPGHRRRSKNPSPPGKTAAAVRTARKLGLGGGAVWPLQAVPRQPRLALRAASAAQRVFTVRAPEPAEQAHTNRSN